VSYCWAAALGALLDTVLPLLLLLLLLLLYRVA
jgi:hypothetical protein